MAQSRKAIFAISTWISIIPQKLKLLPIILPWQESMALDPIRQLSNGAPQDQAERTRIWKDAKVAELSFLGLTVNLHMMRW